jgi:hypothetical protein
VFPYWLLFSIFAAGSLEYRRRGFIGSQANPLFVAAGVFAALMIGFRYEVGGDWGTYTRMFYETRYIGFAAALGIGDPGYTFFNWIAQRLGVEIWFVNLACATIFTWGLIKFARRQPNPWLAALVAVPYLIIVVAMGYTRQAAAIGFILAALAALDRSEITISSVLRVSLYVFGAILFHKSAIIVLPLLALAGAKHRIVTAGAVVLLAVTLYYVFVQSAVDNLVSGYVESQYQSQGALIRTAMNLPPALLYLLVRKRFQLTPAQEKLWRNFAFAALATFVFLMVSSSSAAIDRLALYLIPLQMFVLSRLPEAFSNGQRPNGQVTLAVIAYSAIIQFTWLNYAQNADYWIPYGVFPVGRAIP